MSRTLRIAAKFAGLGFGVAAGLLVYSLSPFRAEMNRVIAVSLCPPSILLTVFIDIQPTTMDLVVMWSLIAPLNAVLYGVVGTALKALLWKSN
jgi:hypothetical protein